MFSTTSPLKVTARLSLNSKEASAMSSNNRESNGASNSQVGTAPSFSKVDAPFKQAVHDAGFESFGDLLSSFNLNSNSDDLEEGMAILRGLFPGKNIVVE
jgi:hypothetical protein